MKKSAFGRDLLKTVKKVTAKKELETIYDFAQHGVLNSPDFTEFNANAYIISNNSFTSTSATPSVQVVQTPKKEEKPKDGKKELTPKELHELKVLNQPEMSIACDKEYVTAQVKILQDKLKLLEERNKDSGATKYGKDEVRSMIERLENRLQYKQFTNTFEEYPYTTNAAVGGLLHHENYLRCKPVNEFIPDMPKEAVDAMTRYSDACKKLCGKLPVFYIIANKKDFEKTDKKRDPILLAQSPYGFVWQILGAWDEEMILLDEL